MTVCADDRRETFSARGAKARAVIANARMYSVSGEAAAHWRALLSLVIERSGLSISLIEHAPPKPIAELWARTDMAGVFMCGLPFSRTEPPPRLIAAPVPSPAEFQGRACYWSEFVVRADSAFAAPGDTFGQRIAFTSPDSQSGYAAALRFFMAHADRVPLFSEVVAPQFTPLGALNAIVDGTADVAPIDSYAFCLLNRYRPDLTSKVRTIGRTEPTPIPVLVASAGGSDGRYSLLQSAFLEADRHEAAARIMRELLLERFVSADASSYQHLRSNFETAKAFWRMRPLARVMHPVFSA